MGVIQTGNKIYEDNSVLHIRSFALYSKDTHSTVKVEISIILM